MIKINPIYIVKKEKKKIKKEFNINDIEKKFDFIKRKFPSEIISVNLIQLYFVMITFQKKSFRRDFIVFLKTINNYLKLVLINLFKGKKLYLSSNLIIFCKHKFVDQINFSETSNFLHKSNKKHLIILNHKKNDFKKISKLYKNKNIINLNDFLNIIDFVRAFLKFILNLNTINKVISSLNCEKVRFTIYNLFFDFFIKSEIWVKIFRKNKVDKLFLSYFSGDTSLIYANKIENKKIKFIGYAFTGLDGDSSRYLFHSLDKLLVLGKVDIKIIKDIKKFKLEFMSLPKKTLVVGSTRHDYFLRKIPPKKKQKENFKILYIKSNPVYINGLEDKALIMFSKIMNNFKNIEYTIKDRENSISPSIQKLIEKKIIQKINLKKPGQIEKYINKTDLCVGTNSTALLRQSINLNKPIIQLFSKNHYMWNTSKILTLADNEKKIIILIKRLINDKKYYAKYCERNRKIKNYILSHELTANKKIYEILK